jgi:hypothetical protein
MRIGSSSYIHITSVKCNDYDKEKYSIRYDSEGQEKYLRELSITPVGYFTGTILHGEN